MASRICARATATTASPGSSAADASSADSADSARRRTRASETPAGLADFIPPPSFSPDHHASSGGSVSGGVRPRRRDSRDGPETPETPETPPRLVETSSFFSSSPPHPLSRSHFPCARSARNRLLAGVADANRPPSVALLDPGASRSFRESSAAALSASSEATTHDVANSANASSLIRVPRVVERRASPLARVSSAAFARTIVFVFVVASSRYAPSASRSAAANASRRAGSAKPRRARASAAAGVSEAACTAERMREAAAAARGASRRRRHSRRVARRGSTTAADAEGVAPLPRDTDGTPPKIEDAGADNERGRGGARGGSWG